MSVFSSRHYVHDVCNCYHHHHFSYHDDDDDDDDDDDGDGDVDSVIVVMVCNLCNYHVELHHCPVPDDYGVDINEQQVCFMVMHCFH